MAVTDENKAVYFSQKVFHEMVGKRLPGLLAIREGFFKPIRALEFCFFFNCCFVVVVFCRCGGGDGGGGGGGATL